MYHSLRFCPSAIFTDKGDEHHTFRRLSFLDIYDLYFKGLRDKEINILEIGVSAYHEEKNLIGCSLWLWKEYFSKSHVYGLDIDPICKKYERPDNDIRIFIGNQDDHSVLEKICNQAGFFDIIIDDGSHVNKYIIKSFNFLFPKLRNGGFYIIEDMGCSYGKIEDWGARKDWPGMKYNRKEDNLNNNRDEMDKFFLQKIKELDIRSSDILSIHFWSQLCVILK